MALGVPVGVRVGHEGLIVTVNVFVRREDLVGLIVWVLVIVEMDGVLLTECVQVGVGDEVPVATCDLLAVAERVNKPLQVWLPVAEIDGLGLLDPEKVLVHV